MLRFKYCVKTNIVYYESIKRELKIRPTYECRCDERLQAKVEEFTRLAYTGLLGGLEHQKIEKLGFSSATLEVGSSVGEKKNLALF